MEDSSTDISDPLISVIMSVADRDYSSLLTQTVESILNQSHRNLELIIVVDGKLDKDKSEYLKKLKNMDKRALTISTRNSAGPAGARNRGIAKASGEFIAIMNADDISERDRIKKQLAFTQRISTDLIGSTYYEIDLSGNVIGEKGIPESSRNVKRTTLFFSPVNNPTVITKTDVLKSHRYDERFRFGEEYRLWITLLRKGYRIENIMDKLPYFRRGPTFYTQRKGIRKALSDFRNKTYTFALASFYLSPLILTFVIISSGVRLLPERLLDVAYRIKYNPWNRYIRTKRLDVSATCIRYLVSICL